MSGQFWANRQKLSVGKYNFLDKGVYQQFLMHVNKMYQLLDT